MRSFEIFVAEELPFSSLADGRAEGDGPEVAPRLRPETGTALLDIFVNGANVTARVGKKHGYSVLRDLAAAVVDLAHRAQGKAHVHFYEDAWELCVERAGDEALLSVYRGGNEPQVLAYDRVVQFGDVRASVSDALLEAAQKSALHGDEFRALAGMIAGDAVTTVGLSAAQAMPVSIDIERDSPISFAADFFLRGSDLESTGRASYARSSTTAIGVERTDLHALLFRGKLRAEIRGRVVDFGESHPFLFAERLLDLTGDVFEAWEAGRAFHVRKEVAGVLLGARLAADGVLSLSMGKGGAKSAGPFTVLRNDAGPATYTFPSLSVVDLVDAASTFGRSLVRALVRRDKNQAKNLRLMAFKKRLRDLESALREAEGADSRINRQPESYRAFVHGSRDAAPPSSTRKEARMRFGETFRALVPGLDLRSTFLCGDKLVVGSENEVFVLNKKSGEVELRTKLPRGTTVATPGGLARLCPDGALHVLDLRTGEVALRTWVAARRGGPLAGCVVNAPGLPKLLVVTEGERHLVAIDLVTGEARWRHAWGKGGAIRMKRMGRLLYVTAGDSALTAIDLLTGAIVWRVRDRLRFRLAPVVEPDAAFTIAGGITAGARAGSTGASGASRATLHAFDPFSGESRFAVSIGEGPVTVEGLPLVAKETVSVLVRGPRGLQLHGFCRSTGERQFVTEGGVAPMGTAWLPVDGTLVGNTPTGELLGIDANKGSMKWNLRLGNLLEADIPRRLEPLLRGGVLFVPHADIHVVRPEDGTLVGKVGPCDAIPDLLRVDDQCNVFLAEESGHVMGFSAAARLALAR